MYVIKKNIIFSYIIFFSIFRNNITVLHFTKINDTISHQCFRYMCFLNIIAVFVFDDYERLFDGTNNLSIFEQYLYQNYYIIKKRE